MLTDALSFMIAMYEMLAFAASVTAIVSMPYYSTLLNKLFWVVVLFVGMQAPLLPIFFHAYFG